MFSYAKKKLDGLTVQVEQVATQLAQLRAERSVLDLEVRIDSLSKDREALRQQIGDLESEKKRSELDIEHKLGLHRVQIESERRIMIAEAEAERLRAVEEAKLAVREGNLKAERKRFEQEIEFRTKRFEEEAATLRGLTEQILSRLPTVTVDRQYRTVETVGPRALEAGGEEE